MPIPSTVVGASLATLAADPVAVAVEAVGIGRQDLEAPEADLAAIEVGRIARDADRRVGRIAVRSGRRRGRRRFVTSHALVDGNKRLGWVADRLFYRMNGTDLRVEADEAFELVVRVADGRLRDVAAIGERLGRWRSGE